MEERVGFYAGSFDPFTNGHLHVVKQAAKIFDKLVIGIGVNPDKKRRYDVDKMKNAIEEVLKNNSLTNVCVISYSKLTVDIAAEYGTTFLVRGIRSGMDYDYEESIAFMNEDNSGIDTIYFRAGNVGNVSSSMVMAFFSHGHDVSKYLPPEVLRLVLNEKNT